MAELEKGAEHAQQQERTAERIEAPAEVLSNGVAKLAKVGGYDFIEATIEGSKNLNPERKALRKIFLTEADKKNERKELKKKLSLWLNLLSDSSRK